MRWPGFEKRWVGVSTFLKRSWVCRIKVENEVVESCSAIDYESPRDVRSSAAGNRPAPPGRGAVLPELEADVRQTKTSQPQVGARTHRTRLVADRPVGPLFVNATSSARVATGQVERGESPPRKPWDELRIRSSNRNAVLQHGTGTPAQRRTLGLPTANTNPNGLRCEAFFS